MKTLTDLLRNEPFKPFTIHLTGGQTLEVGYRESVAKSPISEDVCIFTADGRFHLTNTHHMVDFEVG